MKVTNLVPLIFMTIAASASTNFDAGSAAASVAATSLVGTWELVSTRITRDDNVVLEGGPPEFRALKILNNTHYSVITRRGDQFLRAGAGRYTLSGNAYSETVDLASTSPFTPGAVYTFQIRLEGDTWTIDGGAGPTRFHEVWRRVAR
jgi:hypothetical protein